MIQVVIVSHLEATPYGMYSSMSGIVPRHMYMYIYVHTCMWIHALYRVIHAIFVHVYVYIQVCSAKKEGANPGQLFVYTVHSYVHVHAYLSSIIKMLSCTTIGVSVKNAREY